ncbi:hypothetical protein, conserved [Leishmania tarentolae]|uniref:Centrosomal protein CEP104 N-terminal domain-containing protein n=1 Tax=Leishmania tarentolae TaxID=5689 RepID=A0A640KRK3_LEITA|nr:hypothetical protein, conserved [Leishmania tarentolae]
MVIAMSVALPYDVLFCTSEDPEHPVSQLGGCRGEIKSGAPTPVGWQSVRYGKTPQTLVIRFQGNVWLQQLRILSHEAKIASKVEVRVAKLTEGDDWDNPPSFRNVRFVKLGSVDFNSNEQSHFKSKERKTIHLKTEAYFLKLLFDQPFINAYNTGHQVGIYSLECSGYLIAPIAFHADRLPGVQTLPRRSNSATQPKKQAMRKRQASGVPPALVSIDGQRVRSASNDDGGGDKSVPLAYLQSPSHAPLPHSGGVPSRATANGIFRSLRILEFEDFFLRRSEELVSLKAEAVALEDYHVAAECRDKLALLNSWSKDIYELEQDKVQAIIHERFDIAENLKIRMNTLMEQLFEQTSLPSPTMAPPSARSEERDPGVGSAPRYKGSLSPTPVSLAGTPHGDKAPEHMNTHASDAIEMNEQEEKIIKVSALEPREKAVAHAILSCAGSEEVTSVVLANPGFDIQFLISAVGSFAVACLISRSFQLREAVLIVLAEKMDLLPSAAQNVEDAILRFLDLSAYGLQDSIPNVVAAACAFVRLCLADTSQCVGRVLAPLVALLPRLITRCSDKLQRIRDEAHTTLTMYVKTFSVPSSSILSAALMEPTDKERRNLPLNNARAQMARLSLLQLLVENDRLHVESTGVHSEHVLHKLLLPTVNHPNPEVRDLAVSLLVKLVASRQLAVRDKDLSKITHPGIRETIASKR